MGYAPGQKFDKTIEMGKPVYWRLTTDQFELFKTSNMVDSIALQLYPKGQWMYNIYPHHPKFPWNPDHFGPILVPKKGLTITLDENNYLMYKRVMEAYEYHKVEWKGGQAYIDGAVAKEYTFEQNYFFMMGDNRHGSADSRCWGFVPNDHVVGKALLVVASTNDAGVKKFPNNIRWNRFFRGVN
jgi:signal peptidase I